MKIDTALNRLAYACHDIANTYTDERYLEFINSAIQRAYALLIGAGYPPLVQEITLKDGDSVPHNFMHTCGTYPICVTANTIRLLDNDTDSITVRYFGGPDYLTIDDEDMPFDNETINEIVVRRAILLAINEDEYDSANDKAYLTELEQALQVAMVGPSA